MRTATDGLVRTAVAMVLLVLAAGCTEHTPCDDNQVLRDDGYCHYVDAASPAGNDASPGEVSSSPFFQPCSLDSECASPTVFCAVQPGMPGFCTAFGCDQDPSICPVGAGCMDLTPLGFPEHICIPASPEGSAS